MLEFELSRWKLKVAIQNDQEGQKGYLAFLLKGINGLTLVN